MTLKQILASQARQCWKYKCLALTVGLIVYTSVFILVYMLTLAHRLPPGRPLTLGVIQNSVQNVFRLQPDVENWVDTRHVLFHPFYSNFSRKDLRLSFKLLSNVGDSQTTYDNVAEFRCTQKPFGIRHNPNDTQDLMCVPRPEYIHHLKNPCFYTVSLRQVQCLPYFHVLGADKCGTTDFHSRLTAHPDILENNGGLGKEIYYWCWLRFGLWMMGNMVKRSFTAYLGLFSTPTKSIVDEFTWKKRQLITGDGTPMDFWDFRGWYLDPQNRGLDEPKFLTPHAMRHIYKDPKFFILLRDPAERVYSDYIFLGYGQSPQQFAIDVPRAIEMLKNCLEVNSTRQCFFSDHMYHKLPMRIHISCYSVFLREWFSVFHRKHFFIIRTEDYHADTRGTLLQAYEFLGVSPPANGTVHSIVQQGIKHETHAKKRAGKMLPETRALLDEFFARFNLDLARLLQDKRFLWGTSEFDDS